MGPAFEQAVRDALLSGAFESEIGSVVEVKPWWSRDHQTEIDWLVETDDALWCVEAKWRPNSTVDLADLNRLRGHAARCPALRGKAVRYALATAGNFSERLQKVAALEGVFLMDAERILL